MISNNTKSLYVIVKRGKENWFLYTIEQRPFGKRIEWTSNPNSALIFSSEEAIQTFKTKNLENVAVDIYKLRERTISTDKK